MVMGTMDDYGLEARRSRLECRTKARPFKLFLVPPHGGGSVFELLCHRSPWRGIGVSCIPAHGGGSGIGDDPSPIPVRGDRCEWHLLIIILNGCAQFLSDDLVKHIGK